MLRFLITDDDDVTHAFLRHVLLGLGDVSHAFSGEEAVTSCAGALTEGTPFSCVFMDVLMPGMDGLETIQRIKNLHQPQSSPDPKIIMISCLTETECRQAPHGTPFQADRFIAKPFDRRTILTALAELGFGQPPEWERGEDSW